MHLEMHDQARLCMDRARLAADVAGQEADGAQAVECRIMPFARILQEGGMVLESLPMGRVRLSLGRQAKAREGMRFALWGQRKAVHPATRASWWCCTRGTRTLLPRRCTG